MELWDAYHADGTLAGRDLVRGEPVPEGLYHLVVSILVEHQDGTYLLTKRDSRKPSWPGVYEASAGGSALKGESAEQAARRELREETGIDAPLDRFELLDSERDRNTFYDFYCLKHPIPLGELTLQPGETDGAMWASYGKVHWMIRRKKICRIIARQFYRQERDLKLRNMPKIRSTILDGLKRV